MSQTALAYASLQKTPNALRSPRDWAHRNQNATTPLTDPIVTPDSLVELLRSAPAAAPTF